MFCSVPQSGVRSLSLEKWHLVPCLSQKVTKLAPAPFPVPPSSWVVLYLEGFVLFCFYGWGGGSLDSLFVAVWVCSGVGGGGRWVLDVFLLSVVTSENYGIPKRMFCIFLPWLTHLEPPPYSHAPGSPGAPVVVRGMWAVRPIPWGSTRRSWERPACTIVPPLGNTLCPLLLHFKARALD